MNGTYHIALKAILLLIVFVSGYLLIRSYFKNYELKGNKNELIKRIRILAIITGVISICILISVTYFETTVLFPDLGNGVSATTKSETTFVLWMQSWFVQKAEIGFTFRGISIVCFTISIIGVILAGIRKKDILLIISYSIGVFSSLIIYGDFAHQTSKGIEAMPNIIGVIIMIIFLASMAIIFVSKNKIKKADKEAEE